MSPPDPALINDGINRYGLTTQAPSVDDQIKIMLQAERLEAILDLIEIADIDDVESPQPYERCQG